MATEPTIPAEPAEPVVPPTPLEQAQARLDAYLATERKILEAQSFQVGDGAKARALQRAQLKDVQDAIARLQVEVSTLQNPRRRRVGYLVPW